uniref:CFAP65 fourth Ig-like domain-containing protein n=1 Tax=Amphiprion ocellaris TaxID=80972 RepID=A0A3Q1BG63_AMPOC
IYTTLKAVYRPTQPITHHRRVACVILHRDPVFLDLTGTCHSKLQKPVILTPEHLVDLARRQLSPDTLNAVQHDHDVHLDQQGVLSSMEKVCFQKVGRFSDFPKKYVSITNHTRGKVSLVWTVAQDSPFSISPSLCDLAPLKSTSFRVTYDPKQLNTLHGAELECFAYYKVVLYNIVESPLQQGICFSYIIAKSVVITICLMLWL